MNPRRCHMVFAWLFALLISSSAWAGQTEQTLEIRVSTWPRELDLSNCTVAITAGGETVSAPLMRAAYLGHKSSRPGLWTASFTGSTKHLVEVALTVETKGVAVALWKRLVHFDDPQFDTLSLRADIDRERLRVVRTFWVAYESAPDRRIGKVALMVAFGWGGLAVLYIGLVVGRARR